MATPQQVSFALYKFFGREVEQIARTTRWICRQPLRLGALAWLQMWVLGFLEKPDAGYGFLVHVARDLGVRISRQGIENRLTPAVVPFMQALFERAREGLSNQVALPLALLQRFTVIHVLDSTTEALPDTLQEVYPAAGGDGPQAGLKLQVLWDFLRGNLDGLWLTPARRADQGFQAHRAHVVAGGLFLADLGYFVLDTFKVLVAAGAYFISRHDVKTVLSGGEEGQTRWDLLAELQHTAAAQMERVAWLGQQARIACRVLAVRVPEAVRAERLRRARATARRKGRAFSERQAAWLAWDVYVTNVPDTWLTAAQVRQLYRLRWQIELLFRLWKSEGQLDRIASQHEPRVLCEVYAKLIGMLIFHYLTAPLRWGERELSLPKALHTFRHKLATFREALLHPLTPERLEQVLAALRDEWLTIDVKDTRRMRRSTLQRIDDAARQAVSEQEAYAAVLVNA